MVQRIDRPTYPAGTTHIVCTGCGEFKEVKHFPISKTKPSGHVTKCKKCHRDLANTKYAKLLAKNDLTLRNKSRDRNRRRKEKLATIPRTSNCQMCGHLFSGINRDVGCWDHSHTTGNFRGWLCSNCNILLGCAKDSETILLSAIKYLKEHNV